jgi:hypothetical protein
MNRTSFRLLAAGSFVFSAMMAPALGQPAASNASPELDYDYFKAMVEPVFLAKREATLGASCVIRSTTHRYTLYRCRQARRAGTTSSRVETSS